ncbi:MAG TPA: hypothetical protein VH396_15090 [Chitinophagaceae bacterium]
MLKNSYKSMLYKTLIRDQKMLIVALHWRINNTKDIATLTTFILK